MLVFWLCRVHCSSVSSGISGCNEESRIACRIYRPTPRATGGAVCRTMGRSLVRSVVVVVQRVARSRDIWRYKTHMSCDLVASSFNRCSRCTTVAPGNMKIITITSHDCCILVQWSFTSRTILYIACDSKTTLLQQDGKNILEKRNYRTSEAPIVKGA